jgi:hypothetical protein
MYAEATVMHIVNSFRETCREDGIQIEILQLFDSSEMRHDWSARMLRNSSWPVSGIPAILLANAKQTIEIQMNYTRVPCKNKK